MASIGKQLLPAVLALAASWSLKGWDTVGCCFYSRRSASCSGRAISRLHVYNKENGLMGLLLLMLLLRPRCQRRIDDRHGYVRAEYFYPILTPRGRLN